MYQKGQGVPKYINQAITLYHEGVNKGDYRLAVLLGFLYRGT